MIRSHAMPTCLSLTVLLIAWALVDTATARETPPIRALMVTGGCCHDYAKQKVILSEGISARARVDWTIVHQGGSSTDAKIPLHEKADWAKGFDVVVHNECFANVKDKAWVEGILKPHREGTAAVVIHCAMHCYRVPKYDQWFRFCGVRSHNHGPKSPIEVKVTKKDHPITRNLPSTWKTPKGELYNIAEVYDGTTILATGTNKQKTQPLIWTSRFGKARVFGTTLGHHNETMQQSQYLDMITNGLLWATGKLGDDGRPATGYRPAAKAATAR
ncbi:MAG: ThuA domain-containing protein [Phycisphaerae bacterium]|nr:ThuA domain-containing protein [Phycisphaerae bacterium]